MINRPTIAKYTIHLALLFYSGFHSIHAQDYNIERVGNKDLTEDISGTWIYAINLNTNDPSEAAVGKRIKFIDNGHWSITQSDSNGNVIFHHGGTYGLDGNGYIETVEYANANTRNAIGSQTKFHADIQNDSLKLINFQGSFNELWIRAK